MSNTYQLIWFRQDLRIHDHAALWHATQAGPCIAICILSPTQWQQHDDAAIKIDFYLRQLQQLKQQLARLNIPLIIQNIALWKNIPEYFKNLIEKINIQKEYELIISRVLMFTDSNHFFKNIESLKELFSFNLIRNTVLNTKERISDEIISLFSKTYSLNIKSKFNSNVCFA